MIYGYIYVIKNNFNNKVYVGQTSTTIEDRFKRHCKDGRYETNENSIDYIIYKKGAENFFVELLEQCPRELLNEREIYWINKYNSYKNGYNLTLGGEGNKLYTTKEIQQAISLYQKGIAINKIVEQTGMSLSTLYKYLQSQGISLRDRTEQQNNAALENLKLATEKNKIKVKNITLNIIYNSKKEALQDMINKGYSKAKDWHNIRSPLDKALKDNSKTFLDFKWRLVNE